MCHDPNSLPDGTVVACRKCELCRYNRVKDWAGRNIAQAKVSSASFACTLTYGPELDENRMPIPGRSDHIRAAVLSYSDVQNFLKYLRWLGYPCDYFVTGEHGTLKERAHWHIILHFRGRVPPHEMDVNFSDRHVNQFGKLFQHEVCKAWPHGFMLWRKATFEHVFYNCKYILKDEGDQASQRKPGMSKKPPLGAEYFIRWADLHVEQQLAPQALMYRHKEVKKKDGSPIEFMLKGRTAEIFLERFIARWREVHGDLPRPRSELVDLFEEYGKIVTDEARMLRREQFPKGESKLAFPSASEIKAMASEAKAELEERQRAMADAARDDWQSQWVKDGNSEQERQQRQEIVEFEQFEQQQQRDEEFEQFLRYKEQHGFEFIIGQGWVYSRPGPCVGGHEKFAVWLLAQRARRSTGEPEPQQQRLPPERRGPVGTYNAERWQ